MKLKRVYVDKLIVSKRFEFQPFRLALTVAQLLPHVLLLTVKTYRDHILSILQSLEAKGFVRREGRDRFTLTSKGVNYVVNELIPEIRERIRKAAFERGIV